VRMLMNIEIDTAKGNELIGSGRMGEVMGALMGNLKPEASYFYARNGRRAVTLVADVPDAASIPSLAEPFWLEFNARVEAFPCMNADELGEGISRLG
jgi:hypothetical protein